MKLEAFPKFRLSEDPIGNLADLARVPVAFEVDRVLDVLVPHNGLGGFVLSERALVHRRGGHRGRHSRRDAEHHVAACRFYSRQGCVLGAIDRFAYPELPQEARLLWYKDLPVSPGTAG